MRDNEDASLTNKSIRYGVTMYGKNTTDGVTDRRVTDGARPAALERGGSPIEVVPRRDGPASPASRS